ncbi:MAG TPA: DedA family protein [Kofleriaceae bacterium]|nr:DedA family protein [Kofleriaceae bacterium]
MLHWVLELFAHYGYFVIVAGVLLENAGIPAPGHTVVLAGGFLAERGELSIPWVAVCACAAAIAGDNIGFAIGHAKGPDLLARHRRLFTRSRERRICEFFERHGPHTVVIGRFIAGLQSAVPIVAGTTRMPWRRFITWNVLGAVVWAALYSAAGYFSSSSIDAIDRWMGRVGLVVAGVVVLGAVGVWIWRRHPHHEG